MHRLKPPVEPSWQQLFCLTPRALPARAEPAQGVAGHLHPGCWAVLPVVLSAAPREGAKNRPLPLATSVLRVRAEGRHPGARRARGQGLLVARAGFGQHNRLLLGKPHLARAVSEFLSRAGFHFSVSACRDGAVAAAWPNVPKPPPPMGVAPGALWGSCQSTQPPNTPGTVGQTAAPVPLGSLESLPPASLTSPDISVPFCASSDISCRGTALRCSAPGTAGRWCDRSRLYRPGHSWWNLSLQEKAVGCFRWGLVRG